MLLKRDIGLMVVPSEGGLIGKGKGEGIYCSGLIRDDSPEADDPQTDAAGSSDIADSQPDCICLRSCWQGWSI